MAELTPLDVFARLLDPAFYAALPDGTPLAPEEGAAAYARAVAWAREADPYAPGCPALGDVVGDVVLAFAQGVAAAAAVDRRLLAALRGYLAGALGFMPAAFRLYYRGADGAPRWADF